MKDFAFQLASKVGWVNIFWSVVILSMFTGTSVGSLLMKSMEDDRSVERDMRGLVCMIVSIQENSDARYCEFILSDQTRALINEMRSNRTSRQPPTSTTYSEFVHPWLGTSVTIRGENERR